MSSSVSLDRFTSPRCAVLVCVGLTGVYRSVLCGVEREKRVEF